jgi:hypothetical protein
MLQAVQVADEKLHTKHSNRRMRAFSDARILLTPLSPITRERSRCEIRLTLLCIIFLRSRIAHNIDSGE